MRLLFVAQEAGETPSGVFTILKELCKNWTAKDQIFLLANKSYRTEEEIKRKFTDIQKCKVLLLPYRIPFEVSLEINKLCKSIYFKYFLKILLWFMRLIYAPIVILILAIWLKVKRIDGILSHNGGWPGGELNRWIIIAGRLARIKNNYLIIHNIPALRKRWYQVPWSFVRDRIVSLSCKKIITVSKSCKLSLETNTHFNKDLVVIYNGIETEVTSSPSKILHENFALLQKNNILKIGFIGELSQRKGIHILLKAMALVNRKCEVIIAGSGDEEYKKELLALSKKCKHKVYFLDYVNNMSLVYPYLDIVVLPSLNFESFGMTIIEAMKYKKPVICSDFGGMKEVLEHNITGLVVLANNVFLLKKAIELLINNEEMRISMGLAGRQRLESNFNSARMVGHYEGLFF